MLKGRLVGNAELSDRFLHDYRKTMADCMADNHYGHFTKLTNEKGMQTLCEAAGPSWSQTMCMDALKNLGRVDMLKKDSSDPLSSWEIVTELNLTRPATCPVDGKEVEFGKGWETPIELRNMRWEGGVDKN